MNRKTDVRPAGRSMLIRYLAMVYPTFDELFSPLVDLPCWSVRQGYGSFVTMEFGQPRQNVHDVRTPKSGSLRHPYRVVAIHGEWHLWIYCCNWRMKFRRVRFSFVGSASADATWAKMGR